MVWACQGAGMKHLYCCVRCGDSLQKIICIVLQFCIIQVSNMTLEGLKCAMC